MNFIDTTARLFKLLHSFLETIDNKTYTRPCRILGGATLGEHIRHGLEFYTCLLNALNTGVVNYEARQRDIRLENDKNIACNLLLNIEAALAKQDPQKPLILQLDLHAKENNRIPTTLAREWAYNIEHIIHHMAIIRIAVQELAPSINLSDSFGIAEGTLQYRAKQRKTS